MKRTKDRRDEHRRASGARPEDQPPESPVRMRTRNRMQQLLLTASAIGACACDHSVVCDPLPPPITCTANGNLGSPMSYNSDRISVTARWVQSGSALVARVRISFSLITRYGSQQDAAVAFSGDPQLKGASVARVDRQATVIEFDCAPDAGATTVTVFVPMTCNAGAACYRLELDVRQPQANANVPFSRLPTGC